MDARREPSKSVVRIQPNRAFRERLEARGGESVGRCFQCATCASVCDLATPEAPFPRRQMLWAQWGLVDKLTSDPSVWLCHQCQDCSTRCPRDVRPGDVMHALRAMAVEELSTPKFMGKLVAASKKTWPILIGAPMLFWVVLLFLLGTLHTGHPTPLVYGDVVSHETIYAVFFPLTGLVSLLALVSGIKYWMRLGKSSKRSGSFTAALREVCIEIFVHRRFSTCGVAEPRRWPHFLLFWGFAGAAITSGLIVVAMYGFNEPIPLPQVNPIKILGNVSAIFLIVGVVMLINNRVNHQDSTGTSKPFDNFFLYLVLALTVTGILTEGARYVLPQGVAIAIYILHLGCVVALFATFPFSKFAHMMYRTLAMVHERMARGSSNK